MKTLIVLFFLFMLAGCSKDKDTEDPVVLVSSPTLGQVFHPGDPVHITGTATDDKGVNELYVRVTDAISSAVIIEFESNPGTVSANFDYFFAAGAGIHYRLQVIAKDKTKKDARKTIDFTCN